LDIERLKEFHLIGLLAAKNIFASTAAFLNWFLGAPLYISLVLVSAVVLNALFTRGIKRGVRKAAKSAQKERLGAARKNARTHELTDLMMGERREQRAEAIGQLLKSAAQIMIWATAVLLILTRLGVDIGPLLASAGVVGVALGFGAQTLVKDYLAGIFLIIEDQFGVGDMVDLGVAIGNVEEVSLRVTRLRDMSGVVWYIRNGEIIRVANRSQGWTMASVEIPVAYDEDMDRIRNIIEQIASDMDSDPTYDDMLLGRPEFVGIESVSGEAVFIKVIAKVAPQQQMTLARALRERIKNSFDAAGVSVPILTRPYPTPGTPPTTTRQ
jgi:small-conductance mechanosensitive channel